MTTARISPAWFQSDHGLTWEAVSLVPWLVCEATRSPEERWLLDEDGQPFERKTTLYRSPAPPETTTRAISEMLTKNILEMREDGALGFTWESWGSVLGLTQGGLRTRKCRAKKRSPVVPAREAEAPKGSPAPEPAAPVAESERHAPAFVPEAPVPVVALPGVSRPASVSVIGSQLREALTQGYVDPHTGEFFAPPRPKGLKPLRLPLTSKLDELLDRGFSLEEMIDTVWGLAEMVERGDADPAEWWASTKVFSGYFDTLAQMVAKWKATRERKAEAIRNAAAANTAPAESTLAAIDMGTILQQSEFGGGARG